jgi:DNA-binding transcriptional regulator YiaG
MSPSNWQHERTLTPLQFKRIVKQLGMSQAGAGRYIGVSLRTVRRMVKGQAVVPASAALLLRSLVAHGETPVVPKWIGD